MEFVLVSSLKIRALTSISAALWNNYDMRIYISEVSQLERDEYRCQWEMLRKMVGKRSEMLYLPELLANDLSRFVDGMGFEIICWIYFHKFRYCLVDKLPPKFVWTPHGTIDLAKTAAILARDNSIDLDNRFKLATLYCLENCVFSLWDEFDIDMRYATHCNSCYYRRDQLFVMKYWCVLIKLKTPQSYPWFSFRSNFYTLFSESFKAGNEVPAKFFYLMCEKEFLGQRLINCIIETSTALCDTRNGSIPKDVSYWYKQYTEIFCYILNSLSGEKQIELLKEMPIAALVLFLEWPWQDYFIELYDYMGHFLLEGQFVCLLEQVLLKQKMGRKDYDYQKLFVQLWQKTSLNHRKYICDFRYEVSSLLSKLCKFEYWIAFDQVMKDVTVAKRQQVLLCNKLCKTYRMLICESEWDSVKQFVMKCLHTEEEIVAFRDKVNYSSAAHISFRKFVDFNKLIDSFIRNQKRPTDDSSSQPKRHCVEEV